MEGLLLVTLLWTLCSSLPLESLLPINGTIVSRDSVVDITTSDDTDVNLDGVQLPLEPHLQVNGDIVHEGSIVNNLDVDGVSEDSIVDNLDVDGASEVSIVDNMDVDGVSEDSIVDNWDVDGSSEDSIVDNLDVDGVSEDSIVDNLDVDGVSGDSIVHNLNIDNVSEDSIVHNLDIDNASEDSIVHNLDIDNVSEDSIVHKLDVDGVSEDSYVDNLDVDGMQKLPLEPPLPVNGTILREDSIVDIITSEDTDVSLDVDGVHYHIVGHNARQGRAHVDDHKDDLKVAVEGGKVTEYKSHHNHIGDKHNLDDDIDGKHFIQNTFNLGDIEISGTVQANRISIGSHLNIGGMFLEDIDGHDHHHSPDHKFIGHDVTLPDIDVSGHHDYSKYHHIPGLNAEDEKDLKAAFQYIDENKDEFISADELFNACLKLDIKITAEGARKMVIISKGKEDKPGVDCVQFGHLLKFAPSFNQRDLIHFWVHAAGFHHGHDFEMDDDSKHMRHLYYVFLILDHDHDGELDPTDLMETFHDMGGGLEETEAEKMIANELAGVSYGLSFAQWRQMIEFNAKDHAEHWRKVFRFYVKEGKMTGYHRRKVDSGVRMAVGNDHIVEKLNKLPAITRCPPMEIKAVEDAWIEVVEGLNYKLKIKIKTQVKIGFSCSQEVIKVCENIVVFKPLPNVCKGIHCLRLQDTERIKCQEVSPKMEKCLDDCQEKSCQPERDLRVGCEQKFTCAHGCQMRHLGLDKATCLQNCNSHDECSPVIQGWKFHLCHDCHRHHCSTQVPAKEECEQGCTFYTDVPHVSQRDAVDAVADANAKFACALYGSVKAQEMGNNLLMSPYSASSVLAMAYVGAKGETSKQLMTGMSFPEKNVLGVGYKDVFRVLKGNMRFSLETANKLFVQDGFELLEAFKATMKEKFNSEVKQLDFAESEKTTKEINDWVKKQTNNKIEDLIRLDFLEYELLEAFKAAMKEAQSISKIQDLLQNGLQSSTKMILVNAIYFKGDWVHQFTKEDTYYESFYVTKDKSVMATIMHNHRSAFKMSYCEELKAKTMELPYKGERISMYIVLPDDNDGIDEVEGKLCEKKLKEVCTKTDYQEEKKVSLCLPKFKMEKTIEMSSNLKALGMTDMFSMQADFSGINGKQDLSVMEVFQKAFLQVDELGSEAAAASAVTIGVTSYNPTNLPEFKCDHPFLFFIFDKLTNMMLFRGRVMDPTQS